MFMIITLTIKEIVNQSVRQKFKNFNFILGGRRQIFLLSLLFEITPKLLRVFTRYSEFLRDIFLRDILCKIHRLSSTHFLKISC